ncbi:hypothetical protein NDU88_000346 [Pleurodeles waltl]|uniref:Uncharacterized protein n=1 Tax=Pleurodeles waltl TaxID=8319 RepID=A0AAV7UPQ3_PLEWA|nr:hypothetical protein NDU88_000346 [Pleurodeles waltl]
MQVLPAAVVEDLARAGLDDTWLSATGFPGLVGGPGEVRGAAVSGVAAGGRLPPNCGGRIGSLRSLMACGWAAPGAEAGWLWCRQAGRPCTGIGPSAACYSWSPFTGAR